MLCQFAVGVSGGRGAGVDKSLRAEKCLGREKGFSKPQTPRRPLHALLACVLRIELTAWRLMNIIGTLISQFET
jgi:hypothetical protein